MRRRAIAAVAVALATIAMAIALFSSGAAGASTPGTLDPSFGSGGKVETNVGTEPLVRSAALQPNGDILVGLSIGYPFTDFSLARYTSAGKLDSSFGKGGLVEVSHPESGKGAGIVGEPRDLAVEPSGKILAVGSAETASGAAAFGVARFDENGAVDSTFGAQGIAEVPPPEGDGAAGESLLEEPSGKIVVGGSVVVPQGHISSYGELVRLNPNGTLDTTFGSGGKVVLKGIGAVAALGLDASGDIFIADPTPVGSTTASDETEVSSSGIVDSVVTPETITASSAGYEPGDALAFEPGGDSILAEDYGTAKRSYEVKILRYTDTGAFDSTFAAPLFRYDGSSSTTGTDSAEAAAITPAGNIVVAGNDHPSGASSAPLGVALLEPNGEFDLGFGNGGHLTTSFAGFSSASAFAVLVQPNEDIVVVGSALEGEKSDVVLARYLG